MACRLDKHEKPRKTGEKSGTDRQGNWWKTESWICDACQKTWTKTFGPGR